MADSLKLLIDLNGAGLELDRAAMERFAFSLAQEIQGVLVDEARLAREADIPEGARSGAAAFLMGILLAEVNRANLKKLTDFLGNRFYGTKLVFSYEEDGKKVSFEYRDEAELDRAIARIEAVRAKLGVQVVPVDREVG
ncbi:hypothetical protein [Trichothermofontia sp.]